MCIYESKSRTTGCKGHVNVHMRIPDLPDLEASILTSNFCMHDLILYGIVYPTNNTKLEEMLESYLHVIGIHI